MEKYILNDDSIVVINNDRTESTFTSSLPKLEEKDVEKIVQTRKSSKELLNRSYIELAKSFGFLTSSLATGVVGVGNLVATHDSSSIGILIASGALGVCAYKVNKARKLHKIESAKKQNEYLDIMKNKEIEEKVRVRY